MKKTILAVLSATLLITTTQAVHAEDQKVLAIIDTAINSDKHPAVVYEVCFATSPSVGCPNGQTFMEGKGAASAPWPTSINSPVYHGDFMVKSALKIDPNIKIIFVRYSDVTKLGNSINQPESLIKAIEWVSKNAEKYGIDAVSISQSSISSTNLSRCTSSTQTIDAVAYLNSKNIPTFAATGNDGSIAVIGFPSCVNGITAVGALASTSAFETASNRGPGIDAVAIGKISITKYNGSPVDVSGTSVANVTAAATYVSKNTFTGFTDWFKSLSKLVILNIPYTYISR